MAGTLLTRRTVLRTAALATTTLAAPLVRGACFDEPEHVTFFDESELCFGVANPLLPASLIQSDFRSGDHGNFELVASVFVDDGTMELRHFWHDNSKVDLAWQKGQRVAANVAGAGSMIQSDFQGGDHGNFEVAVPLFANDGTIELWHFWHDNSDVNKPWQRGQRIAAEVSGAGAVIQSNFGSRENNGA